MIFKMHIDFPAGTPLRERLRILWSVYKFRAWFNRSSQERQDQIIAHLAATPGVRVTKRDI
jgi:hypothetical protein